MSPARLDFHGTHALVVEDNPINQQVALGQLAALGISADVAADGTSALRAVEGRRYDVVLMDCQLPGLDGYETTRRLRRLETNGHRTPVVAVTANAGEGEREKCLAAGMDDYLAKPLRIDALSGLLGHLLTPPEGTPPLR
jgi:CheY-like chemotaxis protein